METHCHLFVKYHLYLLPLEKIYIYFGLWKKKWRHFIGFFRSGFRKSNYWEKNVGSFSVSLSFGFCIFCLNKLPVLAGFLDTSFIYKLKLNFPESGLSNQTVFLIRLFFYSTIKGHQFYWSLDQKTWFFFAGRIDQLLDKILHPPFYYTPILFVMLYFAPHFDFHHFL